MTKAPGRLAADAGMERLCSVWVEDLAAVRDAALLDVREAEEFLEASIPGSLNLPLSQLAGRLGEVPSGRPVYVLCGSGGRSMKAVKLLAERGYEAVNVMGGITEWYRAGYPVTFRPAAE